MNDNLYCHLCGELFQIDEFGVSNHIDENGKIDHDADANHVPYSLENEG